MGCVRSIEEVLQTVIGVRIGHDNERSIPQFSADLLFGYFGHRDSGNRCGVNGTEATIMRVEIPDTRQLATHAAEELLSEHGKSLGSLGLIVCFGRRFG